MTEAKCPDGAETLLTLVLLLPILSSAFALSALGSIKLDGGELQTLHIWLSTLFVSLVAIAVVIYGVVFADSQVVRHDCKYAGVTLGVIAAGGACLLLVSPAHPERGLIAAVTGTLGFFIGRVLRRVGKDELPKKERIFLGAVAILMTAGAIGLAYTVIPQAHQPLLLTTTISFAFASLAQGTAAFIKR